MNNRINKVLRVIFLFLFNINVINAAIFGDDNRKLITEDSKYFDLSQSVAVGVLHTMVKDNEDESKSSTIYHDRLDFLCEGEKFKDKTSLSYACTGFLVGPDLLATAGHCLTNDGTTQDETELYCKTYKWVFGYRNDNTQNKELEEVPNENIYSCKKIIFAANESEAPFRDFGLIQLDRKVTNRVPLRLSNRLSSGLFMIGHPLGAPVTVSPDANILLNDYKKTSFITNLDAFEGNSGSPVFNRANQVVGILIGGTPSSSLVPDAKNKCDKYNRCDKFGKNCTKSDNDTGIFNRFQKVGSEVHRINPIIELIKRLN